MIKARAPAPSLRPAAIPLAIASTFLTAPPMVALIGSSLV